jgi:hypothetical protein
MQGLPPQAKPAGELQTGLFSKGLMTVIKADGKRRPQCWKQLELVDL